MHIPVLLNETLEFLRPKPGQVFVDTTFGEGGHAQKILDAVGSKGKLIGIDRDASAIKVASRTFASQIASGQLVLVQATFRELRNVLEELGITTVDGVLADLGVSTEQITSSTRGFSFAHDAPLDMRMDQREDFTAARLLATWDERELRSLFFEAGEHVIASKLARAIVKTRVQHPFERTTDLVSLIEQLTPKRIAARRASHPATKVFLALRVAVNHELEQVEHGIEAAIASLRPGGRLAVIAFHSLEDRVVKQAFKKAASDCVCPPELPVCRCSHRTLVKILTPKPIKPTDQEIAENPRARSAVLRCVERV